MFDVSPGRSTNEHFSAISSFGNGNIAQRHVRHKAVSYLSDVAKLSAVAAYNQRIEEIADRMIAGDKLLLRHRGRRAIRVLATSELFVRAFESA
jgi:hypothetical protein